MTKRLLCILLAALLLLVTASCRTNRRPDGEGSLTDLSTDSEGLSPSDTTGGVSSPEADPDASPSVSAHIDAILLNGSPCLEGNPLTALEAADYTLSVTNSASLSSLTVSGWVGYSMSVDAFGYAIDSGEAIFGSFATYTETAVKEAGGQYALRYTVTASLLSLRPGPHSVTFLARLADGSVVKLLNPILLPLESPAAIANRPYHSVVTGINGKGPHGTDAYTDRGGSIDKGVDILDATVNGHAVDQDRHLRISGWLAVEGGVERYVWSADGLNWYPALTNGQTGEPSEGYFAGLGYENAVGNALFTDLTLDLSPYHDRNIAVTVAGVPKDAPDTVVPFLTVTGLNVPYLPVDIDYSYIANIGNDSIGADLRDTELSYMFEFAYGAGETRYVDEVNGQPYYHYSGIHSFQASMNGAFAMTARVKEMSGCSFLFIRGTRVVCSVAEVPIPLYNFYETDGLGLCGGAGIYAKLEGTTLTVVIKGLDPTVDYRIKNHTFYYTASGSELTLADDGRTVYVLVDGEEITSIRLSGETEYPEHFSKIAPAIRFAQTAEILLANGSTAVVQNTLVASSCNAQCGVAIRGGTILFDKISVVPFSEVIERP